MSQSENLHAEHRKRIKARFLDSGFSSFSQHEILEMLLFYALPRRDTNVIGHRLIKRFGSISSVFDARIEELCEIDGISEHSAILIKMIPLLAKEYMLDLSKDKISFADHDSAGRFFISRFIGSVHEDFYVAALDNGMNLIECVLMHEGEVNSSQVSLRKIVNFATSKDASFVVLAHNHPKGTILPSEDDLVVTNACRMALGLVGITLYEHYIVSGMKYMGITKMRSGDGNE